MELFFTHLIKSCLILSLFLIAYLLFLRKETFFNANRVFLGVGVCTAVLLPFLKITQIVYIERVPLQFIENSTLINSITPSETTAIVDLWIFLGIVYGIGVLVLMLRLVGQFLRIWSIRRASEVQRENSFYHVRTPLKIAPFSFFKHIFYHPKQFAITDLNLIVAHEKVHAKELHSLDILFMELLVILQWFNPLAWYYSAMVKQNLEFVADQKTCKQKIDRKQYQYLMLNQVLSHQNLTIVNPFFNSLTQLSLFGKRIPLGLPGGQIKKRIVMLHQKPSKQTNHLKTLLVIPFIAIFLLAFNIEKELRFKDSAPIANTVKEAPKFNSPILASNIKKVSSGFGEIHHGIYKGKIHKGIDLVAKKGTPVMSSAYGTVVQSAYSSENGNYIVMDHGDGYFSKYLHMDRNVIASNAVIPAGTTIGYVGSTGVATGPHLHFEIVMDNKSVDPESFVAFPGTTKTSKPQSVKKAPQPQKVKTVAKKEKAVGKRIELVITKKTTDAELEKIKADLAKEKIDFSYTVVHNTANEIEAIDFQLSGKSANGGTFNNNYNASTTDGVIKPVVIFIDLENNLVSVGSTKKSNFYKNNTTVWVQDGEETMEEIIIKEEDGVKKIFVDGEEVDEAVYTGQQFKFYVDDEDNSEVKLKLEKNGNNLSSDVFILKDSDSDSDIEIHNNDKTGSLLVETGKGKQPLYYIDGEKATKDDLSKLSPDDIATINVYKGKKAIKKYGRKAKHGVVAVTTK